MSSTMQWDPHLPQMLTTLGLISLGDHHSVAANVQNFGNFSHIPVATVAVHKVYDIILFMRYQML